MFLEMFLSAQVDDAKLAMLEQIAFAFAVKPTEINTQEVGDAGD
jgi:hypothetical protein